MENEGETGFTWGLRGIAYRGPAHIIKDSLDSE